MAMEGTVVVVETVEATVVREDENFVGTINPITEDDDDPGNSTTSIVINSINSIIMDGDGDDEQQQHRRFGLLLLLLLCRLLIILSPCSFKFCILFYSDFLVLYQLSIGSTTGLNQKGLSE